MYPTIETDRLILRPWQNDDFDDLFGLYSNETAMSTMEHERKTNPDSFRLEFLGTVKGDECFSIRLKNSGAFIGYIQLHQYIENHKVSYSQIVTALLPEYWGEGFCTETTKKILHFAFVGIKTPWLCANHFQTNPKAGAVLKKCGLRYHATYKMKNQPYDQYRYTLEEYLTDNALSANIENPYDYTFPIQVSPYSYSKPIRHIDSIRYIKQPTEYLCGQSVIAMLAGVSVDAVIDVMQNDKGAETSELCDALKWYGIKTVTKARLKYKAGMALPDCCILSVKMPTYGHWSLYYQGKYYDPEFGVLDELPAEAKLRYYWEIVLSGKMNLSAFWARFPCRNNTHDTGKD
jgi:RimJ/RimL family protein N-acetyltransferase